MFRVQYVKDLVMPKRHASGTAGLEPVLAAGLDTLIPIYRIHRAELQDKTLRRLACLFFVLLSLVVFLSVL